MDKKIPPVPPRRPIPQKPNIVRQPPQKPVIKKTTEENANETKETKNLEEKVVENAAASTPTETNEKTLQSSQSAVIAEEQTEPKLEEHTEEKQIEAADSDINDEALIEPADGSRDTESNIAQPAVAIENKKPKKTKKEKPKKELSVEKLNEKYRTILLSALSVVCLVGAIVCFAFMVL